MLADRSTSRVTAGQRVALNSIEDAKAEQRDGQTYWVSRCWVCLQLLNGRDLKHPTHSTHHRGAQVYDHISQGSPNLLSPERETYRRAAAVTAVREGTNDHVPYLYTLNFACPSETWDDMEPMFRKVSSVQAGSAYCASMRHAPLHWLTAVAESMLLITRLRAGRVLLQADITRRWLCGTRSAVVALLLNPLQNKSQQIDW